MTFEQRKQRRRTNFLRWWNKNKTNVKAHEWLVRTAKDHSYFYCFHPTPFNMVREIGKRFHCSEYKRLRMDAAWFLWRHTHLLRDEKIEQLQRSGDYFKNQKSQLKEKKAVLVETKAKKVLKKS